jgi:hypothetical protein
MGFEILFPPSKSEYAEEFRVRRFLSEISLEFESSSSRARFLLDLLDGSACIATFVLTKAPGGRLLAIAGLISSKESAKSSARSIQDKSGASTFIDATFLLFI